MASDSLKIKLLSPDAKAPSRGSPKSVGLDLYSIDAVIIPAGTRRLIGTGISMEIPDSTYGHILPRSGLAVKNSIDIGAGVIDPDYRGEVKVLLVNNGGESYTVNKGDRIAQLVIERAWFGDPVIVTELSDTSRGAGGFGSTGVAK